MSMAIYRWLLLSAAVSVLAACAGKDPAPVDARGNTGIAPMSEPSKEEQQKKALEARIVAGMEYLRQRDPQSARRHISRALEIDPGSAEAHNAMAMVYGYEGDSERAEEHFRRAIRIDGKLSKARNNYATLLYEQKRYKEAVEQLEKAVNDPGYDQRAMAFLNLGRSQMQLGNLEAAAEALQRSLRLDSNAVDTMLEMSDVFLRQKKYRDAQAYYANYTRRSRQTARSLLIGIELARYFEDNDARANYEFQLEQLHKGTPEYDAWRQSGAAAGGRP